MLTFVFNAAFHKSETETTTDNDGLRACFFQYCSKDPNGRRDVPISQGILWFLNLCVSYDAHEKKHSDPSKGKMEWHSPFGDALDGNMLGTHAFPALHLPFDIEILPIQSKVDNYNCGFGFIATMAMILRDLVLDDSRSAFDDLFSSTALQPRKCVQQMEKCFATCLTLIFAPCLFFQNSRGTAIYLICKSSGLLYVTVWRSFNMMMSPKSSFLIIMSLIFIQETWH